MKPLSTMREALADPLLLGGALPGASWFGWRTLLIAACGEPLISSNECALYAKLTGGRTYEPGSMTEMWLTISGRRSGKTKAASVMTAYLATLVDWSDVLSLGERGLALFLAPSERQAAFAFRFTSAVIEAVPLLRSLVVGRTADTLSLSNGIDIEVMAASWRRARGGTAIAIVLDECAFLNSSEESANSDTDLLTALRPSLATTNGMLLLTSSPADMQGIVYRTHKRHFGPDGDPHVLVVQSDSRTLNPSLSQRVVDRAYEDDAVAAESEYGGMFRMSLTAYLSRPVIAAATAAGVIERPYVRERTYCAFADPAGGGGRDSFTMAVGHNEYRDGRDVAVVDAALEAKPPFDPDVVASRYSETLKAYGLRSVVGDAYAGSWPVSSFGRCGVDYQHASATKSEIYLHVAPLFSGSRVELLDLPRLADQLANLQRKSGANGREVVDHVRGAHDDVVNAVAGVLWRLSPARPRAALVPPLIGYAQQRTIGDHPGLPALTGAAEFDMRPAAATERADPREIAAALNPICGDAGALPAHLDALKSEWPAW